MTMAGVIRGTRDAASDAWQRFVAFMLDACRADRPHPPPTLTQMYRAMHRLGYT